jgi:hypothetical protein
LKFPELSCKKIEKMFPFSPRLGQGKLTTLRCEIQKIRHENKI